MRILLAALPLALSLTACSTTPPVSTPQSPPAEAAVRCPPLAQVVGLTAVRTDDDAYARLAALMEAYGACAIRHDTLINYVERQ